jgi:hypothetical protein
MIQQNIIRYSTECPLKIVGTNVLIINIDVPRTEHSYD